VSLKKYDQTLHIEPRGSRHMAMAFLFLHGVALIVAANLTMPAWVSVVISVAVLANFFTVFNVHVLGRGRNAILSMVWEDDGEWTLINGHHEKQTASLLPSSYVHTQLVVLNFCLQEGGRRTAILLRDSLSPKTFRDLLKRMQLEAG